MNPGFGPLIQRKPPVGWVFPGGPSNSHSLHLSQLSQQQAKDSPRVSRTPLVERGALVALESGHQVPRVEAHQGFANLHEPTPIRQNLPQAAKAALAAKEDSRGGFGVFRDQILLFTWWLGLPLNNRRIPATESPKRPKGK